MKKENRNESPDKNAAHRKTGSSALKAAAQGKPATEQVKPGATKDVNGASGLRNTGTTVSYDDKG